MVRGREFLKFKLKTEFFKMTPYQALRQWKKLKNDLEKIVEKTTDYESLRGHDVINILLEIKEDVKELCK